MAMRLPLFTLLLAVVHGQTTPSPSSSLTQQSYNGIATITVANTWAFRNCPGGSTFQCTKCPSEASNIQISVNLATNTTCTALNNWWTAQVGPAPNGYNLTSLGYTYVPNPNYASINGIGYYGGSLRIYKITYKPIYDSMPFSSLGWLPQGSGTLPSTIPTDCDASQLIREYVITPLTQCPTSQWSNYTMLPDYHTPYIPQTTTSPWFATDGQIANTFPDTMSWFYGPNTGTKNGIMVGSAGSFPGGLCSSNSTSKTLSITMDPFNRLTATSLSSDTCYIGACGTSTQDLITASQLTYGFEATFSISGFPTPCPPLPTTASAPTQAPTTAEPTQAPITTPCNDTHATLIQQCASFNTSVLFPSANLSFITPLFTPYLTSLSSLTSFNISLTNYTVASTYCNITNLWNTCLNKYDNITIPTVCKQAIVNETNRVIGNTVLPNCTTLTPPITIPTCINGTRLNTTSNTCYNITTCTLLWNTTVIGNSTGNVTQRVFYYDSDVLANGSYCGILNPTQSYMGCTLPALNSNNTYTYTWNDSMKCNATYTSWNVTVPTIISNISCINGTWYNQNQTTLITYTTIFYPNGTSITSNTTTPLPTVTYNSNITCVIVVTTSPPTLPPSSEVTAAPTNNQPTTSSQDKAAGTAMALILGFSALGVGILYWVWFRARRAKANWQNTQQQLQSSQTQHEDVEEEEEQQI